VVAGSSKNKGRGIAHALADEGVHVVIADIETEPAEVVAAEIRQKEVRALVVRTDVVEPDSLAALVSRSYDEFGAVHVLCNNAGVFVGGPLDETSPEEWAWMLAVNLMGVVNGVRFFLPRMRAQGGEAHIVNTGSVSGLYPTPNQGAYAATKYAVVGYSERLRAELEPDGIGVSVLCPSGVRTRIVESRRNRQRQFGGPVPTTPPPGYGSNPNVMDPLQVGRLVVKGIKDNRLYIHTHANFKPNYEQRFKQVLEDFAALETEAASG